MKNTLLLLVLFAIACTPKPETTIAAWVPYDESDEIAANAEHPSGRMQYKLIQSKVTDRNELWKQVADQIAYFSEEDYQTLTPLILEQDIPTLQSHISSGALSYETLTQWYLYRIVKFENDSNNALNSIISINPNAVAEARKRDANKSDDNHPIFGMPILLKDNVNMEGLPTTAGAHALMNNNAPDAFIVERIKEKGGIILGKANLSEWANFFCLGCPNGFTTLGGQTLNPYGPRQFDTGGSSSGSGSAIAANYAAVAVGSETSGSILSPSSSNSIVGLKPTIGLLSRGGIVPISSTLDTPGPMTKNVIDNAILLSAMTGEDPMDPTTKDHKQGYKYWEDLKTGNLEGMRFGVIQNFMEDSIYRMNVQKITELGGDTVIYTSPRIPLDGFGDLLSADMRIDLAGYLSTYASKDITLKSVEDVIAYNQVDSAMRMPYGQGRFEGMLNVNLSETEHQALKDSLLANGIRYFESMMQQHNLDMVLSINNWTAGYAAAAKYPCLTIPMGYQNNGQPIGITFIARPFEEARLLQVGYIYEQATKSRKIPEAYQ